MPKFDLKAFVQKAPKKPGVYQMINSTDEIMYVGKARSLKDRLNSYVQKTVTRKTRAMVSQIARVETILTHTEAEALLLEANLIKEHKPRYNVSLRDDKSYPYIYVSDHKHPRIAYHRGQHSKKGEYFGPYPSAWGVKGTLNTLQKVFKIRQCEDAYYANRSRPCLQYQIQRCSAPCVDYIKADDYQDDIRHAKMFLNGQSTEIITQLGEEMEQAAANLNFEKAGSLRDQIRSLQKVFERQYISDEQGAGDIDIVAGALEAGVSCVQVFFIRNGRNLGNKSFYPHTPADSTLEEIIAGFVTQFYLKHDVPKEILLSHDIPDLDLISEVLCTKAGCQIAIKPNTRGKRNRWVKMASENAVSAVQQKIISKATVTKRLEGLQTLFEMDRSPTRLECFDISHTRGEATVASCVVFGEEGPIKADYRLYNIEGITGGDDYAAMHQALTRRYKRLVKGEGKLPDILFIDGGKGQVTQALDVLKALDVQGVTVIGIAKGPDRIPGMETLIVPHLGRSMNLPPNTPELHLIQQIRDEAHRFAITGHRAKRSKARNRSILEDIPGLGAKRRQQLLKFYGGMRAIKKAGIEDLAKVPGISQKLAKTIYETLQEN